jgi:ADP-ribosylglycohydrolase
MNSHKSYEEDGYNRLDNLDPKISRAIGCFVCAGIGDALGTHTEFLPVEYNRNPILIEGFVGKNLLEDKNRCNLGEFSDDTSMALCLADSLLFKEFQFDGADLQIKFINWRYFSYNNCLKPRRHSFGLGGNIRKTIDHFLKTASEIENLDKNLDKLPQFSNDPDINLNGNGSIMRLSPVPIAFASNPEAIEYAKDYAFYQSKVTHTGLEAAECCRLLTHLIIKFINREDTTEHDNFSNDIKYNIDKALIDFYSENYSVTCLKLSQSEDEEIYGENLKQKIYNPGYNKSIADRNWNWKEKDFKYSPTREKLMPDYIGSYCMDALAMAMHISYYSTSPEDAIIKAVNMGGDCDSVGAVVGMIVGSYYGLDKSILYLYDGMKEFENYKLSYMAYKLYTSEKKFNKKNIHLKDN